MERTELFETAPGNEDNHYCGKIQPTHFNASNRMIFTLANIVKYTSRYKKKGKPIEDLKKAKWYAEFQIDDHWNFQIPVFTPKRIFPKDWFDVQDFNPNQEEVITQVYLYNWTGNLDFLKNALRVLNNMIEIEEKLPMKVNCV